VVGILAINGLYWNIIVHSHDNFLSVNAELDGIDTLGINLFCYKEVLKGAWACVKSQKCREKIAIAELSLLHGTPDFRAPKHDLG